LAEGERRGKGKGKEGLEAEAAAEEEVEVDCGAEDQDEVAGSRCRLGHRRAAVLILAKQRAYAERRADAARAKLKTGEYRICRRAAICVSARLIALVASDD